MTQNKWTLRGRHPMQCLQLFDQALHVVAGLALHSHVPLLIRHAAAVVLQALPHDRYELRVKLIPALFGVCCE
jgi:hypothetical protein